MMALNHRILIGIGAMLLFIATGVAAYLSQPLWLFIPVLLIGLYYLLQLPGMLFYLLLFTIPWSVEYSSPTGLGTDLPDEPLMLLMAFSTLLLVTYRHRNFLKKYKLHPLLILLFLQMVWLLVTVLLSTHFHLSIKYFLAKTWYLLAFVGAPLLLWQEEKVMKRSAFVLLFSMLLVTFISMVRHGLLGFTFAQINDALQPFFRNHVNYSALLVFMVPLQIFFWRQAKTRRSKQLFLLSFFITIPALYLSFARGAWLALIAGLFTYWLIKKRWLFQSFVMAVLLVVALLFWLRHNDRYLRFAHDYQSTIFHQDFHEHLAATYQFKDVSTAERFYRWIAGVRMTEDSWQTGFGPTTFYQHYKSYTIPAFKTWVSRNEEQSTVHNYFLLMIIEQGVLGLLLFLGLLGMLFWYAQRIYHRTDSLSCKRAVAAISAILVMQCVLNSLSDLIETDKVGSVFYLCIAALVIIDIKTKKTTEEPSQLNSSKNNSAV